MNDYDSYFRTGRRIKILIVGDCNVGKTSIVTRFILKNKRLFDNDFKSLDTSKTDLDSDAYNDAYNTTKPTLQGNVHKARFSLNSKEFTLTIADMPGNNQDDVIRKTREYYYSLENSVDVVLICFSLVDFTSFTNVTLNWLPEIKKHFKDAPILLVGTKSDLKHDQITKIFHNRLKYSTGCSLANDSNESNLVNENSLNSFGSSCFVYPPTPPDNNNLKFSSFSKEVRYHSTTSPPNSPNIPPPKPLRSSNVTFKGANSRILTSNLFNLQINMGSQQSDITSLLDDDEEATLLGRNDCLKLKKTINAVKYLECSSQEPLTLITMFNSAIITGAKYYFQKKKLLDNLKRSSWSSDDSFVLIDFHQEISFTPDTTMFRRLNNFYKVQVMNNALKNDEALNRSCFDSTLSPRSSRKNVQFKFNSKSKNNTDNEKNKFFDFFSIFKCHRCSHSDTVLNKDKIQNNA
jgi:small GTP-binding protein